MVCSYDFRYPIIEMPRLKALFSVGKERDIVRITLVKYAFSFDKMMERSSYARKESFRQIQIAITEFSAD